MHWITALPRRLPIRWHPPLTSRKRVRPTKCPTGRASGSAEGVALPAGFSEPSHRDCSGNCPTMWLHFRVLDFSCAIRPTTIANDATSYFRTTAAECVADVNEDSELHYPTRDTFDRDTFDRALVLESSAMPRPSLCMQTASRPVRS
jgi:hypothetical protein